jgi:hypothetical protein
LQNHAGARQLITGGRLRIRKTKKKRSPTGRRKIVVPMSDYGIEVLWALILASLGLSAVAVVFSIFHRRQSRTPAVTYIAGEDVASEAARKVLREFEKNGQSADAALITWSPDILRKILADDLPETQVIVVSNREPYIHNIKDDGVELLVPASGLVSALEPITRACAGTWIA